MSRIVDTVLPTTMVVRIPGRTGSTSNCSAATSASRSREVQTRRSVRRCGRDRDSGSGRGRPRHRHRREHVVRRLHRSRSAPFAGTLYERIPGFEPAREPHPSFVNAEASFSKAMFDDWGGVINSGPVKCGPIRWADLYTVAKKHAKVPVKVFRRCRPVNLAWHAYFKHYKKREGTELRADSGVQRRDEEPRRGGRDVFCRSKTSAPGCRSSRATRTTTRGSRT